MKKLKKLSLKELQSNSLFELADLRGFIGGSGEYIPSGCPATNALYFLNQCEIEGQDANQNILNWLGTCGGLSPEQYANDETPWCSAFVNAMVVDAGYSGTNSASANSWSTWRNATSSPQVGDIAVAKDGHHVGIITNVVDGVYYMTSGNNGEAGCVQTYTVTSTNYNFRTY
jgi:uncharacterized protein (TIGR02594 family)